MNKNEILDFLGSQIMCAIATNGADGFPNVASVAFSHTDALEFVIATDEASRKAKNMAADNKVALTVTDMSRKQTVQLEGEARRLSRQEFEKKYAEAHFKKLPFSLPFKAIPTQTYYVIVPTHMKLTDVSKKPWEVTEIIR